MCSNTVLSIKGVASFDIRRQLCEVYFNVRKWINKFNGRRDIRDNRFLISPHRRVKAKGSV